MKIKEYLDKPFPQVEKNKQKIIVVFLFALFIYSFLIVFQPFGLSEIQFYKPVFIFGYFIITFIVMLFNLTVLRIIFKKIFNPEKWTVKKEILFISWQILIIAIFNWLYTTILGEDIVEQQDLLSFLLITIAVGIFPIFFLIIYIEKHLTKKNKILAKELTNKINIPEKKEKIKQLKIFSDNKKEIIELELQHLICINSEGNYVTVFYYKNGEVKKKLIRNSLSKIGEQLIIFETIKRCHRSYIINLQNVDKVSGNARNYNFHIKNLDFTIPVSRNFPKSIIESI